MDRGYVLGVTNDRDVVVGAVVLKFSVCPQVSMSSSNYTQPVSVPVNISYGDSGLLQSSPQMAHTSISPRPSSSETDSVYPSGGMPEMSNGYPNSASPMGGSPSPGPSPGPGLSSSKQHPKQHSPGPRSNLRVVIPTALGPSIPPPEDVSYGEVSNIKFACSAGEPVRKVNT
jgi:MADS-box transcription enhancer factor 2A